MYLNPLSVNNYYFGNRNNSQKVSAPIKMQVPLMADTVSFGNSNNKAREVVIKVVKDIFKQLEASKNADVSDSAKAQFSDTAGGVFKKLHKNLENIKNANLSTTYDPDIMMKDGAGVHLYKTLGGYIFDHVTPNDKGLLNAIEIGYDGRAKISSVIAGEKGQTITKSASAILDTNPIITSVEFRNG